MQPAVGMEKKFDCVSSRVACTGSLLLLSLWSLQMRIRSSRVVMGKRQLYCGLYVALSGAAFYRCFFAKNLVPESERYWVKRIFV